MAGQISKLDPKQLQPIDPNKLQGSSGKPRIKGPFIDRFFGGGGSKNQAAASTSAYDQLIQAMGAMSQAPMSATSSSTDLRTEASLLVTKPLK